MTTWVLLRGLARESRHWGAFRPALAGCLPPGDALVAPDLPGNGRRLRERSPATIAGLLQAVRSELAASGRAPPYVAVALSLGAMVAMEWARAHPQELAGCVLVNSSTRALSWPWQRLRPAALAQFLALAWPGPALARETRILRLTSNLPVDAAVAQAWADHARAAPVSAGNALRQLAAAARHRGPVEAPAVPLLLLASRRDRVVSVACSRAMARAWRAPLREHPGAGHDLALDDPQWLAGQVMAWWAAQPGRGLRAAAPPLQPGAR